MVIPLIVPELHDIGKFIDWKATDIQHNFENYPRQLKNDTWRGIVEHHCSRNFQKYPTSPDTLKLHIADDLATTFSRYTIEAEEPALPVEEEDTYDFSTHKLWKPSNKIMAQSLITSTEGIEELISFLAKNPTADEFSAQYESWLKLRTEHATRGKNITSLYTHSKLTGQFFRILTANHSSFPVASEELKGRTKEEVNALIKKKKNEWKISILRCKLNFAQTPIRAKDMNVFKMQEELIKDIERESPNNVFFNTSNEILLIVPDSQELLEKMKKRIKELGFWMEVVYAETQISAIKPQIEDIQGKKQIAIYPELQNEVSPPICELCQLSKANEQPWIDEESGINEFLCEKCWKIRQAGSLLPKIATWERMEQNPKVCWIKIWLDYKMLLSGLATLYRSYLESIKMKVPEEIDIRFAIVSEFQHDYKEFLSDLWNGVGENFGGENVQEILQDFIAVKINSLSQIKSILSLYNRTFEKYFPKFHDIDSPLKVAIGASNVKFPFLEIWRMLYDVRTDVNVYAIGKGSIHLKGKEVGDFLNLNLPSKTLLHKITQIDDMSPKLGKILLYDREDRDFRRYEPIREAIERYGHRNVLTYAKMMSD